jgi:hypothetical protein
MNRIEQGDLEELLEMSYRFMSSEKKSRAKRT